MRKIYLSFIGLGKNGEYKPTCYSFNGRTLQATPFVQAAEIQWYGSDYFDRLVILMTPESEAQNWQKLEQALLCLDVPKDRILTHRISSEITDPVQHWKWFQQLLDIIEPGDRLVLDMTHGFRAVPIVISSALGYLQNVKNISLDAVLYGADQKDGAPIVDMKDFYTITKWTEAVSRLIENADTQMIAELAQTSGNHQFTYLHDKELIEALSKLTGLLKNIDVNAISSAASQALTIIQKKMNQCPSDAERQLLQLIVDKFSSFVSAEPVSGLYDDAYLELQLAIVRALLDHGLFMQAFTVLRELVGSIGMAGLAGTKYGNTTMTSQKGQGYYRKSFAECFVKMLQVKEQEWKFNTSQQKANSILTPWYEMLKKNDVEKNLRNAVSTLVKIRNGFDHAWTSEKMSSISDNGDKPLDAIMAKGNEAYELLSQVIAIIKTRNLIPASSKE
ncbi:MAG: TIGR02221 family CRISPR-associated protein [Chitinivibrionales bacterium]|nr:TIGR02221 family CRISPR-associated protein [Chitinivibrionales bacterium]